MTTCKCSNPIIVAPNPPEIRCLTCGGIVPPPTSEELIHSEFRAAVASVLERSIPSDDNSGLQPLLDLPGALEIIKQSGYEQQPTEQPGWLFVHPDYGSGYCQTEKDVLDFAEAMIAARESMRGAMVEAGYSELTDDEIEYISGHW